MRSATFNKTASSSVKLREECVDTSWLRVFFPKAMLLSANPLRQGQAVGVNLHSVPVSLICCPSDSHSASSLLAEVS